MRGIGSYVERRQTAAVGVEGLVVELNKLFCELNCNRLDLWLENGGDGLSGCSMEENWLGVAGQRLCASASAAEGDETRTSNGGEVWNEKLG